MCLLVTSPSKECLDLLGHLIHVERWLEVKELLHFHFVRKYVWLEGKKTPLKQKLNFVLERTDLRYDRPNCEIPFSSRVTGGLTGTVGKSQTFLLAANIPVFL